jgi:hypothetical protein
MALASAMVASTSRRKEMFRARRARMLS